MARVQALAFAPEAIEVIDLTDPSPIEEPAPEVETAPVGEVARQAGAGATLGAVAGAAAGMVTAIVTGNPAAGTAIGAAGAAAGSVVGGIAGTYLGLPATESAWTVYEGDPDEPHPITIRVRVTTRSEAELARTALRGDPASSPTKTTPTRSTRSPSE